MKPLIREYEVELAQVMMKGRSAISMYPITHVRHILKYYFESYYPFTLEVIPSELVTHCKDIKYSLKYKDEGSSFFLHCMDAYLLDKLDMELL